MATPCEPWTFWILILLLASAKAHRITSYSNSTSTSQSSNALQPTSVTSDSSSGTNAAPSGDVSQYLASLFSAVSPEPLFEVCTSSAWASYSAWRSANGEENGDDRATITEMPRPTARALPAFTYSPASPCCGSCFVSAGPVRLVHWPTPAIDPGVTAITSGTFTFTSPTQYIVFASLFASNACGTQGSPVGMATLGFTPGQLSSILHWVSSAGTTTSDITTMVNFADLGTSCASIVDAGTSLDVYKTINGNVYRDRMCYPDIDIPPAAIALNTEWATCTGLTHGAYDPPIVLMTEDALVPGSAPAPSITPASPPAATSVAPITPTPTPPRPSPAPPSPASSSTPSTKKPAKPSSRPVGINHDPGPSMEKPSEPNSKSSTPNLHHSSPHAPAQPTDPPPNGPNSPPMHTHVNAQSNSQNGGPGIGGIIFTALGGNLSPSHAPKHTSSVAKPIPTPVVVSIPTPAAKSSASVVAAGQTFVVPAASKVVIGQKTLSAGGVAVVASGTIFSVNAAGSLVVRPSPTAGPNHNSGVEGNGGVVDPELGVAAVTTMTVDGEVTTATLPSVTAPGASLLAGGRPLEAGGVQISVASGGVIIVDSSTLSFPAGTLGESIPTGTSPDILTIGEAVVTLGPSGVYVDGKTLTAGGPAATVGGTSVGFGGNGTMAQGNGTVTTGVAAFRGMTSRGLPLQGGLFAFSVALAFGVLWP